jgi:carnitine O-acetyltransferase
VPHDDDARPHDETGKVSFDDIYDRPDPRLYFRTLRDFGYGIPQAARPHFARLVDESRGARDVAMPTVLDVGCSYGVNAVLLRRGVSLDDLYARYAGATGGRHELLAGDRTLAGDGERVTARFVGLDTSAPALGYAMSAGFLDDAVAADLEADEPTEAQREQLAGTDVVISTGCIGYVTEKTLLRVLDAARRPPWMAHYCLRMFPYREIAGQLDDLGYVTAAEGPPVRQRRFVSAREQELVLERLAALGIEGDSFEGQGWLYAQLYVSRPAGEG